MESNIENVLGKIRESELVELCRELVRIPSESGHEKAIADFIYDRLSEWGFDVEKQDVAKDRPNVIGRLKGLVGTPSLMLNGHMDTVPAGEMTVDPYGAEVRNGRLYGRGASDTKGGLAVMLMAARAVKDAGIKLLGDLILAAVVDEEKNGLGTSHLARLKLGAQYGIVVEPTSLGIVLAHKGQCLIELIVKGKSAHGSTPEMGVSAIYEMMKAINELLTYSEKFKNITHPLLGHPTINIGTIHGGTTHCAVPDRCHIEIDRRLLPGETPKKALDEMDAVLSAMRKEDPTFDYELFLSKGFSLEYGNGLDCSPNEPVVEALVKAGEVAIGKRLGFKGQSGTTDAAILSSPPLSIRSVVFGPGGEAHTSDESVEIRELVEATKTLSVAIINLLGS